MSGETIKYKQIYKMQLWKNYYVITKKRETRFTH